MDIGKSKDSAKIVADQKSAKFGTYWEMKVCLPQFCHRIHFEK